MSFSEFPDTPDSHPLFPVIRLAQQRDWILEKDPEAENGDELMITLTGAFSDYRLRFAWTEDPHSVHCACALDMSVPDHRLADVYALMAAINEKIWLGHFVIWSGQGLPVFRYTILPDAESGLDESLVEEVVDLAVGECERFLIAFQIVALGSGTVEEALGAALMDVQGHA